MTNNSDVKASGVVKLPENLQNLPRADYFPTQRHRWNTNEEIASVLICLEKHQEWLSKEVKTRPKSGSMLLYSRKKVRYRRDGYCWKKRKDGKTTREDHMKLKVQGVECIYGCYVHSAILSTFHRRCYWLLQNPDIVLVHYLNVPYTEDNKASITPRLSYCMDKKEWTKDELVSQLKPMFYSENEPDLNNELEISTAETIDAIVHQLIEKQRAGSKACVKELSCEDSNKSGSCENKKCAHVSPRVISPKTDSVVASLSSNESLVPATITSHSNTQNTSSLIITTNTPNGISSSMHISATSSTPVILGLSQLHNGSGLLILNSSPATSSVNTPNTISIPWVPISVAEGTKVNAVPLVCEPSKVIDQSAQIVIPVEKEENVSFKVKEELLENTSSTQRNLITQESNIQELNQKNEVLNLGDDILDLSHDDIQKTLSANMPSSSQISQKLCGSPDLNPMDFIDSDITTADDLVNLEAFDMLADFPDLETINTDLGNPMDYHPSTSSIHGSCLKKSSSMIDLSPNSNNNNSPLTITDFSPEWAYPEGGMKILVTGPWYSASSYNCLFGGISVSASLVQSGVLRCYCPAHEVGLVSLQVACDGCLISNSVIFEYKARPHSIKSDNMEDWLTPDENEFNMAILERLEQMEKKVTSGGSNLLKSSQGYSHSSQKENTFENRLVAFCQQLSLWMWLKSDDIHPLPCHHRGLTLLHLAAALGYTKLVKALIQWRSDNPSIILEAEVDALTRDDKNCTPLMWACACGHIDTAFLLYQWNSQALHVCNSFGQLPLTVARTQGHTALADRLEQLEHTRISYMTLTSKSIPVSYDMNFNRSFFDRMPCTSSLSDSAIYSSRSQLEKSSSLMSEEVSFISSPSDPSSEQDSRQRRSRLCKRPSVDSGRHTPSTDPSRKFTRHDDMGLCLSPILMSSPSECPLSTSPLESTFNTERIFQEAMNEESSDDLQLTESDDLRQSGGNLFMDSRHEMDNIFIDLGKADEKNDILRHRLLEKTTVNLVGSSDDPPDTRVLTLAEQIIAAIPERIKTPSYSEGLDDMGKENMDISHDSPGEITKIDDDSTSQDVDAFNFSDNTYRYCDVSTPNSSLSPASSCLQSPCSFPLDSPSPPPTTADFCEFFQASGKMMEKDFSQLTLSDREQRELYEAAKIIQNAYRQYKGRRKQREQEKERQAAILIQSYYRRYKQYAYFKRMTKAAVVIQNLFRTYCAHKRFKKNKEAAACVQTHCRNSSFRRRQQAARKIQQFMRQSKNKLQKERAERETVLQQQGVQVLQECQSVVDDQGYQIETV